jgi:hypothetical protein
MELTVFTTVRADQVRAGDLVLGFASVPLVVDEVHHKMRDDSVLVILWCWPADGERTSRRSTLEYDSGDAQVAVLPAPGPVTTAIWDGLRAAIVRARNAWDDDQDVDGAAQVREAAPWDAEDLGAPNGDITVRAAGRTWQVRPGPPPNTHSG